MKLRHERKYLVANNKLDDLRKRFIPFLYPDLFAQETEGKTQYTVRSIYFDSVDFNALSEKKEGVENRLKLRIRGYNTYFPGCEVFLEIKRKYGNLIAKNRAITSYDFLEKTLLTGELVDYSGKNTKNMKDDASRFLFHLHREAQKPVNTVVYEREAYHGKFDPEVRITFDKNIRAVVNPELRDLFCNRGLVYIWDEAFILEIKYHTPEMPTWAKSIVHEFELRHEALSKFASVFENVKVAPFHIKN